MPEKKCELIKVRTIFYADFISLLFRVMLLWKKKNYDNGNKNSLFHEFKQLLRKCFNEISFLSTYG